MLILQHSLDLLFLDFGIKYYFSDSPLEKCLNVFQSAVTKRLFKKPSTIQLLILVNVINISQRKSLKAVF